MLSMNIYEYSVSSVALLIVVVHAIGSPMNKIPIHRFAISFVVVLFEFYRKR